MGTDQGAGEALLPGSGGEGDPEGDRHPAVRGTYGRRPVSEETGRFFLLKTETLQTACRRAAVRAKMQRFANVRTGANPFFTTNVKKGLKNRQKTQK